MWVAVIYLFLILNKYFFHTNILHFTSLIPINDRHQHNCYIFGNPRTWQITWHFFLVCLDTLARFYFRVFDEYSKIDFFCVARKREKIFSSRICTCIFVTLFVREIIILFFGILFFFSKNGNFSSEKNRRKNPNGPKWCLENLVPPNFFIFP